MLVDEIDISVEAGHGGAGRVSFVPSRNQKGGPDGGNGGRGGDVYIRVVSDLTVLDRYTNHKVIKGEDGEKGGKQNKFGSAGKDIEFVLPLGTTLTDLDTGETEELLQVDERILVAKGGLGGKGNFEFRSSTRTTPRFAQPGLPGEKRNFKAELKLIAQFGLIGLPNAGKSSLLNELTKANVKVAEYPFTTLESNLGVLEGNPSTPASRSGRGRILADIPGLIEGASEGKGLGMKFLKHIEKVELLLHCIAVDAVDIENDYKVIINELKNFSPELVKKKEIILLTKSDLIEKDELNKKINLLKKFKKPVFPISIHDWDSLENLKTYLLSI